MVRALVLASLLVASGCGGSAHPDPRKDSVPTLRLPADVRPLRYRVELTLDPSQATFAGRVAISLDMRGSHTGVWLNATDLEISNARLSGPAGSATRPARVRKGNRDVVFVDWAEQANAGTLELDYVGTLSDKDLTGLFRQREGDDWYAFSQFEATEARRAFPCFDEPGFKVPFQLVLHVKTGDLAISNTPIVGEQPEANGMKRVEFAETKPLPTYLVALAVGPFDAVSVPSRVPMRIVTPRGRRDQASAAAAMIPEILGRLEKYFGTPYPYEKLDSVAVPHFFGAMENAGLVTYSQSLLLAKPEEVTPRWQRGFASVCAHELAHQWFGDLVTMKWWDDLWLNESFASWMAAKVLDEWKPEWEVAIDRVNDRLLAMEADSLASARKIRQPIESKSDIEGAFDDITYDKGQAVLEMFERSLGEEVFQRGVRRFLAEHAWGSATTAEFLSAMGGETQFALAASLRSFLDQPGVPVVTVGLDCGGASPTLRLAQEQYFPSGARAGEPRLWKIPFCVAFPNAGGRESRCLELDQPIAAMPLADCAEWILPNPGMRGYYHLAYDEGLLMGTLSQLSALTPAERVGMLWDVRASVRAGRLPLGAALKLLPLWSQDENLRVVTAASEFVRAALDDRLIEPHFRKARARFIHALFGARASQLGWLGKPGEDDASRMLRPVLVPLVADFGDERWLLRSAVELADRWITEPDVIDPDVIDGVLAVAAHGGDVGLFDRLVEKVRHESDRLVRSRIFGALGAFREPVVAGRALALLLDPAIDAEEAFDVIWLQRDEPETAQLAYDFIKKNFDALVARLPRDAGPSLVNAVNAFCDAEHRADVERFFHDKPADYLGGTRRLSQTLEKIEVCAAFVAAQRKSAEDFLATY